VIYFSWIPACQIVHNEKLTAENARTRRKNNKRERARNSALFLVFLASLSELCGLIRNGNNLSREEWYQGQNFKSAIVNRNFQAFTTESTETFWICDLTFVCDLEFAVCVLFGFWFLVFVFYSFHPCLPLLHLLSLSRTFRVL